MTDYQDNKEVEIRMPARGFAMELSDSEIEEVSGAGCSGTQTTSKSGDGDLALDCSF